jgi:hypothetical protein
VDFAEARMYGFSLGRFTSPDPLQASASANRPQSWNRYAYSYNNPLRYTDPSGMIAGDFYNQDGKYIGTDGNPDDKVYLVTDKNEAQKIEKTKGNYTAKVNSALELPSYDVRQEIGVAAVARSNAKTTDDKVGGNHEEGGTVVSTTNGQVAIPAKAGAVGNQNAVIDVFTPANPTQAAAIGQTITNPDIVTTYHIHPSGSTPIEEEKPLSATNVTVIGGSETVKSKVWTQEPSQVDQTFASGVKAQLGYHIVVGARNNTVYFYNGTTKNGNTYIGKMPLNTFNTVRAGRR